MDKIIVAYWISPIKDLKYKHQEEFPYSIRKRNQIINTVLSKGHQIMSYTSQSDPKILMIWIDVRGGRFRQR